MLEVNQDPLGLQAAPVWHNGDKEVIYMKHLEDGSVALGLFNRGEKAVKIKFTLEQLGLRDKQTVRDLWRQTDVAALEGKEAFSTEVAPHGVALLRVYPGNPR